MQSASPTPAMQCMVVKFQEGYCEGENPPEGGRVCALTKFYGCVGGASSAAAVSASENSEKMADE